MPLPTRVAHEQVGPPVAVVVALGDPHAGVRVGKAGAAGPVDEAEPKAPRGQIDVVAVRVLVVRDVEVEPPVAVQIGEHGAERVVVRSRVDARLPSDLAEAGAPVGAVAPVQEEQVADPEIDRLGVKAFTAIAAHLGQRMSEGGVDIIDNETAAVGALMAMLERFNYALASRRLILDDDAVLDTLAHIIHRGFFGAPAR